MFVRLLLAQQGTTTPVTIRVTDASGAVVPHAQLRLVPAPDPLPAKFETDDHGEFFIDLRAGDYALSVAAQGFGTCTRHIDIKIPGGRVAPIPFIAVVLQVGQSSASTVYPAAAADGLMLTADSYHSPLALAAVDFHALPHVSITVHNVHTDATESYSGVPISTLLDRVNAPLGKELHGEAMALYLIATGSDGYSVVLSLAEVGPSFHEGQIIVADARDGQPLGKSGPFQLIVSEDKRPARWVHNLVSITLRDGR